MGVHDRFETKKYPSDYLFAGIFFLVSLITFVQLFPYIFQQTRPDRAWGAEYKFPCIIEVYLYSVEYSSVSPLVYKLWRTYRIVCVDFFAALSLLIAAWFSYEKHKKDFGRDKSKKVKIKAYVCDTLKEYGVYDRRRERLFASLCQDKYEACKAAGESEEEAFAHCIEGTEGKIAGYVKKNNRQYAFALKLSVCMLIVSVIEMYISSSLLAPVAIYAVELIVVVAALIGLWGYMLATRKKRYWYDYLFAGLLFIVWAVTLIGFTSRVSYAGIADWTCRAGYKFPCFLEIYTYRSTPVRIICFDFLAAFLSVVVAAVMYGKYKKMEGRK